MSLLQRHSVCSHCGHDHDNNGNTMDIIKQIIDWNRDAGNTTNAWNRRQSALYMGLQCEELAEKLKVLGFGSEAFMLNELSYKLKRGNRDHLFHTVYCRDMLDADLDIIVVSIGAAMSQGADVSGGMQEIIRSNESKRDNRGKLVKDENGKIIKGPGYSPPDLGPHLLKTL